MKFLLLLLVVIGAVAWLAIGRRRPPGGASRDGAAPPAPPPKAAASAGPQAIVACAHCDVHLPAADALRDAADRPYCSEAHRQAGPRRTG